MKARGQPLNAMFDEVCPTNLVAFGKARSFKRHGLLVSAKYRKRTGGRNRKEQGDPVTLHMGKNQPRRTAEHTPRQPPDPVSYWLIAEKRNNRIGVLTIRTVGEQETLPVFSSEEEAEIILRFGGLTGAWRATESRVGELLSVLSGPCAGVKKVALDPSPEMVVEETIELVSLSGESFMGLIMARRGGPLELEESQERHRSLPRGDGALEGLSEPSIMGGASQLGYEQITLRAYTFVGVGTEEKYIAAPRYSLGWR